MAIKHAGAKNELTACIWLLMNGYDVFRNISQHGIADLLAMKDGKVLKLDVKSASVSIHTGYEIASIISAEQILNGVQLLYVFPDGRCTLEINKNSKDKPCLLCGKEFKRTTVNHCYCSRECRPSIKNKELISKNGVA